MWAVRYGSSPRGSDNARPASAALVDNATCVQCHQAQANAWANSHHAKAMAKATPASVLGDFGGVDFEHKGVVSHFFKKGDKYFVRT